MKSIINGLLYDTDVAEQIYLDSHKNRTYYKTSNGNYFVFYATGEITPTTENNIKELLGTHDTNKYIELFGEPKEA